MDRSRILKLLCLILALGAALAMAGCAELLYVLEAVESAPEATADPAPLVLVEETPKAILSATPKATLAATPEATLAATPKATPAPTSAIDEDGSYTEKDDVALYIHTYGRLPSNFMTKDEARKLGWSGGSLERYAPGKCIGGDKFGNYEGLLPTASGRRYTECDIDTLGASSRGAKRIVFSNDGLIYYTDDHYESFELLYGEE